MPQTKQKDVHASDKQAVESLQLAKRRAKFRSFSKPLKIKKRKKKPQIVPINKSSSSPIRLESLETSTTGWGSHKKANPKVGQRRKDVPDPRFNKNRGDRKEDPINLVGKAIDKDKTSRLRRKRIQRRR
jgi:hypothetical protein